MLSTTGNLSNIMASIRYSSLVGAASGSVGGVTFSAGKSGAIARSRGRSAQPESASQLGSRALYTRALTAWSALTLSQRTSWATAAAQLRVTNAVGLARPLTARGLWTKCAIPLLQANATLPTVFNPAAYVDPYTSLTAVAVSGGPMYLTFAIAACPIGQGVQIYGARTFSTSPAAPVPKLKRIITTTTSRFYTDLYTPFRAIWGTPAIGERLVFEAVHFRSGYIGPHRWRAECYVLNRSTTDLITNGSFEGTWVGTIPTPWQNLQNYTTTREQTNPIAGANSWKLSVGDIANYAIAYLGGVTLNPSYTYDFRCQISISAGKLDYIDIQHPPYTNPIMAQNITGPWSGELQHTFSYPTATSSGALRFYQSPHTPGTYTVDNVTIRRIL